MATMGVQMLGDNGAGFSKLGDTLAKALFGDAETEMKLALQRQDYESEAWRRKVWEAQAANQQSVADTNEWELGARQRNVPVVQDYYGGMVEPPQPVDVPDVPIPVPTARPEMPVPVEQPNLLTDPMAAAAQLGQATAAQQPMPVPVDPNAGIMPQATGEALPAGAPAAAPQAMPGPTADTPVSPEQWAAYNREVAARRAEAELIIAGGGTANQMAQGLGVGEGIIKSGSQDPAVAAQGALLYTGQPGATGGDIELVQKLRKEFQATPEFQKWSAVHAGYQNMRSAMQTLANVDPEDPRRGPADMRLIYNYLKILDPQTGVKEGEYSSARESGGAYAGLWNLYDGVLSGAVLDQATRVAFLREGEGAYKVATEGLAPHVQQLGSEAQRMGVDINRVVTEPETVDPYQTPAPQGISEELINAKIQQALPDVISREQAIALLMRGRGQ